MNMEIGHAQIAQKDATVGVRIASHSTVALRSQFGQVRSQSPILIEQLFGLVAFHPALKQLDVIGMLCVYQKRHLVCSKRTFDLQAVHEFRPSPTLW